MSTLLCPLFNHNTHKQANRCSLQKTQYSLCSGKSQTAPQVHFYNTEPEVLHRVLPSDSVTTNTAQYLPLSSELVTFAEGVLKCVCVCGGLSLIRILSSVFPHGGCRGLLIALGNIIDLDPVLQSVSVLRCLHIPLVCCLDTLQDTAAQRGAFNTQCLHWLCTWPGLSFHRSCTATHTHTHTCSGGCPSMQCSVGL